MKKFFTLTAGLLLASSAAFGQAKWTNVIINGDFEGDQDPKWSSFWCHDYRKGVEFDPESGQEYQDGDSENGQFRGFAEVVVDPDNPNNHCAKVIIRSEAEADEAGNKVEADGKLASWDCQFFIYATEPIAQGKEVKLTLKVKGLKAGSFETQAHWKPGDYNHYQLFGNKNFGIEWTEIETDVVEVSADQSKEADGKFFQSVAFNLSTTTEGNVVYFDDIKLEVKDGTPPKELEGWFDVLKSGGKVGEDVYQWTYNLNKKIGRNTNPYFTVSGIQNDGKGTVPCPIVNDPVDGQPAYTLTTTVATEWADTTINIDGTNKSPVPYFIRHREVEGDTLEILKGYTTQLFIGGCHVFKKGEKYHFKMMMRATQETSASAQAHYSPGDYKHWQMLSGSITPNEEWQEYTYDGEISSDQAGTTSIAFNLNEWNFNAPENDKPITYYFRDIEYCVNSADVSESDRVLASDTVAWAAPAKSADPTAGVEVKADLTNALQALGVESVEELMNGRFKVLASDGDDIVPVEISELDYFIDGQGLYADQGINVFCDVESAEGNVVPFTLFNTDIETNAQTNIATKIYFIKDEDAEPAEEHVKRGWDYELNILILGDDVMGVSVLKNDVKADGAIYDLSGRRVAKAVKGLYIKDGKKIIVK